MLNFNTPMNTRLAPSPSGNAHIGFTRTLYHNWLAARSTGGKFLLRIDDTDKARSTKEFENNILETVKWLGLDFDLTFRQSERYDRYQEVAQQLIGQGQARVKDGATYLWVNDNNLHNNWKDLIAGEIAVSKKDHEAVQNLVLLRADDSPTYHFASCIDDMDMGVNLVIRGTDHISNTSKQIHIWDAIGLQDNHPLFAHEGLIFHNGKKISKRDGLADMQYYKDNFSPEAVLNAVLKLGWSHPDAEIDKRLPLINKETAIKIFKEGHLKAVKSTLDLGKLIWLDKKYRKI